MKKQATILYKASIAKQLSVCLMVLALGFLTTVNFFIYSSDNLADNTSIATESKSSVPSPTEEKSSGSGFSILEEMIHESHFNSELSWFNKVFLHKVAEAQKTEMVHFDLWSPPPERFPGKL